MKTRIWTKIKRVLPQDKKTETVNSTPEESFRYYRLNSKHRKVKNTPRAKHHRKVTSNFWKKVGEYMVEKEGGVFVDRMGYFCVGMVPEKLFSRKKYEKGRHLNPHTKSRVYFPILITNKHDHFLKVFTMDRNFSDKVKAGINKKLKSGFKYINLYKYIYDSFVFHYRKIKNS